MTIHMPESFHENDICVVIPSFGPPPILTQLSRELRERGIGQLLIVNDGSDATYDVIFREAITQGAEVINLPANQGKGAAIKHAIRHLLSKPHPPRWVAFCDDDGQHSVSDVLAVIKYAQDNNSDFVIGSRSFTPRPPLKSLVGNVFMSHFLHLLLRHKVRDTQSGLRVLSLKAATSIIGIPDNRFSFEMKALIHLLQQEIIPQEISIETIYHHSNALTRFRPLKDSGQVIWATIKSVMNKK